MEVGLFRSLQVAGERACNWIRTHSMTRSQWEHTQTYTSQVFERDMKTGGGRGVKLPKDSNYMGRLIQPLWWHTTKVLWGINRFFNVPLATEYREEFHKSVGQISMLTWAWMWMPCVPIMTFECEKISRLLYFALKLNERCATCLNSDHISYSTQKRQLLVESPWWRTYLQRSFC